ncbi:transcription factor domain-containing protein [Aspergillus alliaceus]|uniref:transcription factor domain-containing protein n=1 Tax=Petromyces alliaceus TaxID=209559 RepID=UPI0012A5EFD4|nr:fungal-specific transcription factor domain-containing protein [Aspergillus alliaceus]KAB8238720.1 fungal-specific transcription factor domain-containing protein [Aspergillus alliaceus]
MSTALLETIPSTVAAALNIIDKGSKSVEVQKLTGLMVGPFGVFKAEKPQEPGLEASFTSEGALSPEGPSHDSDLGNMPPDSTLSNENMYNIKFLSGNEADTRIYLTEMERLARLRGLTKLAVSRRAHLLHSIYAWMRIVSESTNMSVGMGTSSAGPVIQPRANTALLRAVNLELTLDSFLHHEASSAAREDPQSSIGDIDLTRSPRDQGNMYMQIYGVSEAWLTLVSQITRLANFMDRLSPNQKEDDAVTLASLLLKASSLEEAVCSFNVHHNMSMPKTTKSYLCESLENTPHVHMVRALSAALAIFFYQRIRNVNLILQESVNHVSEALYAFDLALEERNLLGPGTAWPAFIAGAEAMTKQRRDRFTAWLDRAFSKSGWAVVRVDPEKQAAGSITGNPEVKTTVTTNRSSSFGRGK